MNPENGHSMGLKAKAITSFSFLAQHRFLPCENKSQAVEQVKSAFNKVSLGGIVVETKCTEQGSATTSPCPRPRVGKASQA